MPILQREQSELETAATAIYERSWKENLEAEHFGEIIAVEPQSQDYVLGKTFREVTQLRRERFPSCPVFIFRIGGGGAVKIGGAIARGRHP